MWKWLIILFACSWMLGCEERRNLAPVVEAHWRESNSVTKHKVLPRETLYSIAFRYDQDYRQLAAINHIPAPYFLAVGQIIYLKPLRPVKYNNIRSFTLVPKSNIAIQPIRRSPPILQRAGAWQWPTRGAVLSGFAPEQGRKGIEIAGRRGQSIYATTNGTVAYAGDGLPGYGNLILIKHSNQLLSAYGYNAQNLVREGQTVHAGQIIASMGTGPHHRYALHFEVRKAGRPINPYNFLH